MSTGKRTVDGPTIKVGPYPELTWTSVLVGWLIGALIAVSIGYAALILGFSIEGSELAAILGWGVLRGVLRRTSILENNINQTIASAVNGASAGIMFTVPALFILARRPGLESVDDFGLNARLLIIFSSITGCIIGLAFVIPLRKQMIDFDRLAYPGGIAVATILKSPGAGMHKAMLLLGGALISGLVHIYVIYLHGTEDWLAGEAFGLPSMLNLVVYLSVMTIGVGFLSGKGGFWFGAGGFICYWLLSPILAVIGGTDLQPVVRGMESIRAGQVVNFGDIQGEVLELTPRSITIKTPAGDVIATAQGELVPGEMRLNLYRPGEMAGVAAVTTTGFDSIVAKETVSLGEVEGEVTNVMNGAIVVRTSTGEIVPASPNEVGPTGMRMKLYRPTGIGMLIGAAIGGIIAAFPLILSALRSLNKVGRESAEGEFVQNDEMPIALLYFAVIAGAIAMIGIAYLSAPDDMTIWRAVTMAVLGTLWIWVAGVIVSECVGRTNWSPLSGMTLIAVTIVVLIAKSGLPPAAAVFTSIVVGAAICLAISQASDMMLDLKSGYLVGALPRRQQFAQFIGAWLGPIIVVALMIVLNKETPIGSEQLPAPQATALATVIEGIMSDNVPTYRYMAGGGLGLLLACSGLGGIGVLVGLGFYMPFNIVLTYTVGNILRIVVDKVKGKRFSHEVGIPIAAGFIVGEALVGVGHAIIQVFLKSSTG